MCGSKEPIAGVFVLLLLAAGSWAAQEPFPHFGSDIAPDSQTSSKVILKPVQLRQLPPLDKPRFSDAGLKSDHVYAVASTL
ncbi:hypothetical protein GIV19_19935 [Pseudomonas syringae]|uniref:hypothetical protein n=1 Tax=Pseudomonas syringae TaxID=317 RepID=UPI001F1E6CFE|nr:hypothetical protein [Pseudomonas syringae]MCF5709536.1 hypothetical protein [Pseudomonas syringae]